VGSEQGRAKLCLRRESSGGKKNQDCEKNQKDGICKFREALPSKVKRPKEKTEKVKLWIGPQKPRLIRPETKEKNEPPIKRKNILHPQTRTPKRTILTRTRRRNKSKRRKCCSDRNSKRECAVTEDTWAVMRKTVFGMCAK